MFFESSTVPESLVRTVNRIPDLILLRLFHLPVLASKGYPSCGLID